MNEPPKDYIEHNPNEPKIDRGNTVFYVAWAIVAVLWIGTFLTDVGFHLFSVCLGGFTMAVLIISVTELTGNDPPKWWR